MTVQPASKNKTEQSVLAFMTEETLVTIANLATRSRPPLRELKRQVDIAQSGIDAIDRDVVEAMGAQYPLILEVISTRADVALWCARWR